MVRKRLRGNIMPTTSPPHFEDKVEDAVIATDGTVKGGRGGAAYSIHSTATPGSVRLVLPVDGAPRHLTSYRTKLFGILGSLLLLQNILLAEDKLWHHLTALVWCDNEAAVRRFDALQGSNHFSIASANHSDADVLHELRQLKASLPIRVNASCTGNEKLP